MEFNIKEHIQQRKRSLKSKSKAITTPIIINQCLERICELNLLQEALDKWEKEHKEEVCGWTKSSNHIFFANCNKFWIDKHDYTYCPYCSKKIKEV